MTDSSRIVSDRSPTQTALESQTTPLSQSASVDQASIQPLPGSRKVYIEGSRADIRVPMREISLADTPTAFGGEANEPVRVYDTSGPYTDPNVSIDVRKGLSPLRQDWIDERGDTEQLDGLSSDYGRQREAFGRARQPALRTQAQAAAGQVRC